MKRFSFPIFILAIFIINSFFIFYIVTNLKTSVAKDHPVSNNSMPDVKIQEYLQSLIPVNISVDFAGIVVEVPTSALGIELDQAKLNALNGKVDFYSTGIDEVTSISSPQAIYTYLPLSSSPNLSESMSFDENLFVKNCDSFKFYEEQSILPTENEILGNLRMGGLLKLKLNSQAENAIKGCRKYNDEFKQIQEGSLFEDTIAKEIFGVSLVNNNLTWGVKDYSKLEKNLELLRTNTDSMANEGSYEIMNNKIYLYSPYAVGKRLNIQTSIANYQKYLDLKLDKVKLQIDDINPKVLSMGYEILDFTEFMGSGKTRLDIIRNGVPNGSLPPAQNGILELDNVVVNSGEVFSYLKHVSPDAYGYSKNGRYLGSGVCNSTTTLFRAVLESGLPVLERSFHAHNYESYAWGYPLNIVDAAYFSYPEVDFKFKNDLDYPILIKVEIGRPGDAYQYHTVSFYTSSKAPKRSVTLSDFRLGKVYSSKIFEGAFKRTVTENDRVVIEEEFYSRYW